MIPSMLCSPITCQTHNQMESPTTTTNTQYGGYLRDGLLWPVTPLLEI